MHYQHPFFLYHWFQKKWIGWMWSVCVGRGGVLQHISKVNHLHSSFHSFSSKTMWTNKYDYYFKFWATPTSFPEYRLSRCFGFTASLFLVTRPYYLDAAVCRNFKPFSEDTHCQRMLALCILAIEHTGTRHDQKRAYNVGLQNRLHLSMEVLKKD